jgi:hypothetical protein
LKPFIPQGAPSPKLAPLQLASPQAVSPHPQEAAGADWHESQPHEAAAGAGVGCWHSLQPQALLPISLPRHNCARDCSLALNKQKVNMSAAAHILAKNGDRIVSNPFENWVLSWRKLAKQCSRNVSTRRSKKCGIITGTRKLRFQQQRLPNHRQHKAEN